MKRVLIYEHVTGGGMAGEELQESWLQEGSAMRLAAIRAFQQAGCIVSTFQDSRISLEIDIECFEISRPAQLAPALLSAMAQTDHGVLIAPETDGILASLAEWAQPQQGWNLGCTAEAVRLCSDKLQCANFFEANQILHPSTWQADQPSSNWRSTDGWIVFKPRDGAGSLDTFKAPSHFDLNQVTHRGPGQMLVQSFSPGESLSLSVLCDGWGEIVPIGVCRHNFKPISDSQGFWDLSHYDPEFEPDFPIDRLQNCMKALQLIPGLRGWVGVDFIWDPQLKTDTVVEINPRLTSSFCWIQTARDISKIADQWLSILEQSHL